ncbi:ligand-dependent nuclear receptor-interacting factor 1 [Acipenser oxyrinchus oxyrinchus]|uniref:Ligand-dependent nuclear receptor-interacting factor 1 n=1 Tax=Acipenser oxyrinchus oxyrinchus TaxID=40147 RepID=A0AAD8CLH9_ACIOX|nr:ligand-dependent nuclear receptor-interacting factor 1 [Acipenser oxyrinchus oxyrinchus]
MNNIKQISIQSIAGGMYQVLPAVGADGKNILKLIPVQKADGKYIRSVTSTNAASSYKQAVVEPARVVTPTNIRFTTTDISQSQLPILQQTSQIKYILKSPSNGPVTLNHTGRRPVEGNGTLPSTSSSVQVSPGPVLPIQNQNLVLVPTSVVNSEGTFSTLNPKHLPITLKSSVFPNGHLLQIPVNAKVKTVPASALPPVIQQKIHATSISSGSGTPEPKTNLQTVLYVTPVNTVRMATTKATIHPSPTAESQSPNLKTTQQSVKTTPVKGPSGPSRFCSSNKQSQGKPIKWVVEEYPDSPAPYIVPVNKPNKNSMSTNICKSIEKSAENAAPPPAVFQETQSQISSGKDNALVMCNGKVFFLAKKSPELIVPPVQKQDANEAAQRINTETSQSTDCVKHADVDFEIISTQSQRSATSGAVVPGSARRDDTTPIIITDDADDLSSEVQEVGYSKPDVIFVSYIKPKKLPVANVEVGSVPEILTIKDDEPEKSSTGPVQGFSADVLVDKSCQRESDSQLRKRFEITSDVRICLEKIQPQMLRTTAAEEISSVASTSRCPLEGIRKLIQESNAIIRTKKSAPATVEVKVDEGKRAPQKRKSESSPPSTKKSRAESPERNCETACTTQSPITSTPEPPSLSLPTANPSTGMMETEEAVPSCSNTLGTVSQELCSPAACEQHVGKAAGTSTDQHCLVEAAGTSTDQHCLVEAAGTSTDQHCLVEAAGTSIDQHCLVEAAGTSIDQHCLVEAAGTSTDQHCLVEAAGTSTDQHCLVEAAGTSTDQHCLVEAPVEFDEVVRDEKIKRLKYMLKQQEAALELIRSKRRVP